MRRVIVLCVLGLAVTGFAGTMATASVTSRSSSASTELIQDAVGDAGSGPDISIVTATVSGDSLTLAATFANRSGLSNAESVQFFLQTNDGGTLDAAFFADGEARLDVWTGTAYQDVHDIVGTWSGNTFSTTLSLSDLQSSVHQSVFPNLELQVDSITNSVSDSSVSPTIADRAPDIGFAPIPTQPVTTTTTTPTTTVTTTTTTTPSAPRPQLVQKTVRVGSRVEWKKLEVHAVPSGAHVSIACTKACSVTERPLVSHGVAVSKRFVGVPFARGATFVIRVLRGSGTGYWFRLTVKGASATSARGCIAKGGRLAGPSGC